MKREKLHQGRHAFLLLIWLSFIQVEASTQDSQFSKSTRDLNFLIGQWDITRTYSPGGEGERILHGSLVCEESLDGKFIKCTYEMERPGRIRGLDVVYFNYNSIYNQYESMWLSSTWPIKVIMKGQLQDVEGDLVLATSAEFQIENKVMEYVRDEMKVSSFDISAENSFIRQTHIRTSEYEEGVWHHHMTEIARRI